MRPESKLFVGSGRFVFSFFGYFSTHFICFPNYFFIFAEDNQKSCISLIISIVVSTVLFMVTI